MSMDVTVANHLGSSDTGTLRRKPHYPVSTVSSSLVRSGRIRPQIEPRRWPMKPDFEQTAPKTMTVPNAGRIYFGLGRNASYDAAKRGDIPTIKIGRLLRVPVAAMERRLEQAA